MNHVHSVLKKQTSGFPAAPLVSPSGRWGQTLCPIDAQTAILIGGQGARKQFCKDPMWKLCTGQSVPQFCFVFVFFKFPPDSMSKQVFLPLSNRGHVLGRGGDSGGGADA